MRRRAVSADRPRREHTLCSLRMTNRMSLRRREGRQEVDSRAKRTKGLAIPQRRINESRRLHFVVSLILPFIVSLILPFVVSLIPFVVSLILSFVVSSILPFVVSSILPFVVSSILPFVVSSSPPLESIPLILYIPLE